MLLHFFIFKTFCFFSVIRFYWCDFSGARTVTGIKINFLFCTKVYPISKQCCDSFRWTAKGLSHTYTRIHSPPNPHPIQAAHNIWNSVCVSCPVMSDSLPPPGLCHPPGFSAHGVSQTVILEWVAISFSKGIFPAQGSNPHLLHCRRTLYCLSHQGSAQG